MITALKVLAIKAGYKRRVVSNSVVAEIMRLKNRKIEPLRVLSEADIRAARYEEEKQ